MSSVELTNAQRVAIKAQRESVGWSQEKLAATADVSRASVQNVEGSAERISPRTLAKITGALRAERISLLGVEPSTIAELAGVPVAVARRAAGGDSVAESVTAVIDDVLTSLESVPPRDAQLAEMQSVERDRQASGSKRSKLIGE